MTPPTDPRLKDLARREAHRLRDEAFDRFWQRLAQALRRPRAAVFRPAKEQPCHS